MHDGQALITLLLLTGVFDHLTINENLDREADYSLWDMTQVDCGEFTVTRHIIKVINKT